MSEINLDSLHLININGFDFYYGWDGSLGGNEKFHIVIQDINQITKPGYIEALTLLRNLENELTCLDKFSTHPLLGFSAFMPDDAEFIIGTPEDEEDFRPISDKEWLEKFGTAAASEHPKKEEITKTAKNVLNSKLNGFDEQKKNAQDWLDLLK